MSYEENAGGRSWGQSDHKDSRGDRRQGDRNDRYSSGGGRNDGGGNWRSSGSSRGYGGDSRSFGRDGGGRDGGYRRRDEGNDYGSRGGGGGYQRGGGNDNYRSYDDSEKTTIKIPSSDVGRVIGRGGSTIKDLQSKSGARIKVQNNQNNYDDAEASVDLFGSDEERKAAEELINEVLSQARRN